MIAPLTKVSRTGSAQVSTNATDITGLDGRLTTNEGAVASHTTDIGNTAVLLAATGASVAVNQASIIALDTAVATKASQTALALKADASALQTLSNDVATHASLAYTQVQVDGLLAALPTGASAAVQANIVSGVQTLAEVNTSGDCAVAGALTSATVSTSGNVVVGANVVLGTNIYLYGSSGIISCASLSQSSPAVGTTLCTQMWSKTELA
jgi:hypothetical protein